MTRITTTKKEKENKSTKTMQKHNEIIEHHLMVSLAIHSPGQSGQNFHVSNVFGKMNEWQPSNGDNSFSAI